MTFDFLTTIFSIIILILSVMFHELAHGTVADWLGDPTPRLAGRLTLNPIAHLELVGSFILPLLCVLSGTGFIIGWAKPIPFNPRFFKSQRWGPALVAIAGPAMNIIFALVCAGCFRLFALSTGSFAFAQMLSLVVVINISLSIFNLIPIPPLDGHHILGAIIPKYRIWSENALRGDGFVIMIVVILIAGSFIAPVVEFLARLLLGA